MLRIEQYLAGGDRRRGANRYGAAGLRARPPRDFGAAWSCWATRILPGAAIAMASASPRDRVPRSTSTGARGTATSAKVARRSRSAARFDWRTRPYRTGAYVVLADADRFAVSSRPPDGSS